MLQAVSWKYSRKIITLIKIHMRFKCILVCCCAMNFIAAFAQTSLLHGRVVDEVNGQPLSCANISLLKGDKLIETTITDSSGNFKLNLNGDSFYIKAEYLGYFPSILNLNSKLPDTIQLKLILSPIELHEIAIKTFHTPVKKSCIDCNMPTYCKQVEMKIIKPSQRFIPLGDVAHFVAMQVPLVYAEDGGEDGRLFFAGSREDANKYLIDGNVVYGDPHIPLNTIQWINVTTFGFEAKYGDFTGGIIEVGTRNTIGY